MPCASTIEEAVQMAEARWPGYEFRIVGNAAHGLCPICGKATDDGFTIFSDGGFFCRPGGCTGWLDDDQQHAWTAEEIRLRKIEAEIKRLARQVQEHEERLTAIERLNRSQVHERYHNNLDAAAYEWWAGKGVECWAIQEYKLGYCARCPTDTEHHRPSYTIPLPNQDRSALLNLRHRLAHADNGDKYRPECAGLGTCLAFPHHLVGADKGIILEGEIKSIVTGQYGLPTVGLMGKRGRFQTAWLDYFPKGKPVYIGLDPDATENAERLGAGIAKTGKETYVIDWPYKPDDMLVEGCTVDEWMHYVRQARRVH